MRAGSLGFVAYCRCLRPIMREIMGMVVCVTCGCRVANPNSAKPVACKHGRVGESARHFHL